jgi:hypothetical protein
MKNEARFRWLSGHAGLAVCVYRPGMAQAKIPFVAFMQVELKTNTHVGTSGHIPIESTSVDKFGTLGMEKVRQEHLLRSRFVPPSTIDLDFDDARFSLDIGLLEMPLDRIQWASATVSSTGDAMIVRAVKGENVPIDSSTLRCLVDPSYAAQISASLKALKLTREERAELATNEPPPEWFTEPEQDFRLDSWK